jgi:tape measure domain-containing protein
MSKKVVGIYGEVGIKGLKQSLKDISKLKNQLDAVKENLNKIKAKNKSDIAGLKAKHRETIRGLREEQKAYRQRDQAERKARAASQARRARETRESVLTRTAFSFNRQLLGAQPQMNDAQFQSLMAKYNSATSGYKSGEKSKAVFDKEMAEVNNKLRHFNEQRLGKERAIRKEANELIRVRRQELREAERIARARAMDSSRRASAVDITNRQFFATGARGGGNQLIDRTRQSINNLNQSLLRGDISMRQYRVGVNAVMRDMRRAQMQTTSWTHHLKKLRSTLIGFTGAFTVFAGIKAVAEVGKGFESTESSMLAALGSTQAVSAEMEFLTALTKRLGLTVNETANAYAKLTFSAKDGMSQQQIRDLFTGLTEFGTVMGIDAERMKWSLMAVQQMANKGKISMEELRRQLAENMPGTFQIFAAAAGVSTEELEALVESGNLLAKDVLPQFGIALQEAARNGGALEAKMLTLRVAEGKMRHEWEAFQKTIFDSGMSRVLTEIYRATGDLLAGLKPFLAPLVGFFSGFISSFTWLIRLIAAMLGDFADFLGPDTIQFLADLGYTLGQVLGLFTNIFGGIIKVFGAIFSKVFGPIIEIIKFMLPTLRKLGIASGTANSTRGAIGQASGMAAKALSGNVALKIGSGGNLAGTVAKTYIELDMSPAAKRTLNANVRGSMAQEMDRSSK